MPSRVVCFVCGSVGAELSIHVKARDKGPYFPFLEHHDPPKGCRLPRPDGLVDSCRVCYAFLTQQWEAYERNKTPAIKRLYWLKRADNGHYTGAEMKLQGEYMAQVMGLQYQTSNDGYNNPPSPERPTYSRDGYLVQGNHPNHASNHAPNHHQSEPVRSHRPVQQAPDGVLDLSVGPSKVTGDQNRPNQPHHHVRDSYVCFTCAKERPIAGCKLVSAIRQGGNEPYFPFLEKLHVPRGAMPITNQGIVQTCEHCFASLCQQWLAYERAGAPISARMYTVGDDLPSKPQIRQPHIRDTQEGYEKGKDSETCYLCGQGYPIKAIRPLYTSASKDNKLYMYFPFIRELRRPHGARPLNPDGTVLVCQNCHHNLQNQWCHYEAKKIPLIQRRYSLLPVTGSYSQPPPPVEKPAPPAKETEKHPKAPSDGSDVTQPLNIQISKSPLPSTTQNSSQGLLAIAQPVVKTEAYEINTSAASLTSNSVNNALAARVLEHHRQLTETKTTPSGTSIPHPLQQATSIPKKVCFICGEKCLITKARTLCSYPVRHEAKTPNGQSAPFFPFLASRDPATGADPMTEEGTVIACSYCYCSLHTQWKELEESKDPEDHKRWVRKYCVQDFVCFVCATSVPRKSIRTLEVHKFAFLKDHKVPAHALVFGTGEEIAACTSCASSLRHQFSEYERMGVPDDHRKYNWMQQPHLPGNAMEENSCDSRDQDAPVSGYGSVAVCDEDDSNVSLPDSYRPGEELHHNVVIGDQDLPTSILPSTCSRRRRQRPGQGRSENFRTPSVKKQKQDTCTEISPESSTSAELLVKYFIGIYDPILEFAGYITCLRIAVSPSRILSQQKKQRIQDHHEVTHENPESFAEVECQLPRMQQYLEILLERGVVACSNNGNVAFVVPDMQLENQYRIVRLRVVKCSDDVQSIYTCSCNQMRHSLLWSLPSHYNGSCEDLLRMNSDYETVKECLHIEAMKEMNPDKTFEMSSPVEKEHSYSTKQDNQQIFAIAEDESVLCIYCPKKDSYGILRVNFGQSVTAVCTTCHQSSCSHLEILNKSNDEEALIFNQLLQEPAAFRPRYAPYCKSKSPIPFNVAKPEFVPTNTLAPAGSDCCCNCVMSKRPLYDAVVVTTKESYPTSVYDLKCDVCGSEREYDGAKDSLLDMGNYFVTHQVLSSYSKLFLTDGTTLYSYYKTLVWGHLENGDMEIKQHLSYYRFRHAWYAYLNLLDVNTDGFSCPECGNEPQTVIMDGVTLGIRKVLMGTSVQIEPTRNLDGSFSSRVFIPGKKCRNLLKKYATTGLAEGGFKELQELSQTYAPSLCPLFHYFHENDFISKAPKPFSSLLCSLSSDYPLLALVHSDPVVLDILQAESLGQNFRNSVTSMLHLQENVPTLFALLTSFEETPDFLRIILSSVVDSLRHLMSIPPHPLKAEDIPCNDTEWFPTLPIRNHRGSYVLDNARTEAKCLKKVGSHKTLTPGLFTLACRHGICYGFAMMQDAESPNLPFTLLRTRFKTAPRMVIYDNCCNLSSYALNRDPGFFRDTWFVVDRFHWPNHKGCHDGYNLSIYKQHSAINSQVAEQRNSLLKKLRSMLSYMDKKNFMEHCKFYMWFHSKMAIVSHFPEKEHQYSSIFNSLKKVFSFSSK